MRCPICDQKPMNCDCTETERRQYVELEELEEQVANLRLTDAEREAIEEAIFTCECAALCDKADADDERREANVVSTLRALIERTK
jgi:hypothetical protein